MIRMGSQQVAVFGAIHRKRLLAAAFMGTLLPMAVATASNFGSHPPVFFLGAAGACAASLVVLVPRRYPVPFYLGAYGGLPCLAMLQADSGGAASGYSVLLMMPMLWFGLQATDRELVVAGVVLAACSYLPMLVFGPPAYPVEWGHATLLVLVGSAVAGSLRTLSRQTQWLTDRLRREAVIDDLTGLLNRRGWRTPPVASSPVRAAGTCPSPWSRSTSTGSRSSTTRSGTRRATGCSARRATGCGGRSAQPTWWPGWAATSSPRS